ncbi:hypothetical protein STCU_04397 [Strigomonas culicis]|nr:hypothetical protein STCU_04397 [Strigomonas culicis]|eukprot:EPY29624.1 hypothetical protein STCU_04397 [Strigomonas culicis]
MSNPPMQVSTSSSPLTLGVNGTASSRPQFPYQQPRPSSKLMPTNSPTSLATQLNSLKQPPKYRPPEQYLEHNLPPALALPLRTSTAHVAQTFTRCMLQN